MAGADLLGLGFGAAQNASLSLMFERVPVSGYNMVSAMYNLAYDAGMGLGAATFGVLAVRTGYRRGPSWRVGLLRSVLGLAPVWRDRAWAGRALRPRASSTSPAGTPRRWPARASRTRP